MIQGPIEESALMRMDRPLNVFFDDQVFQAQEFGGISRYFCALSNELAQIGVPVRLFGGISRNRHLQNLSSTSGLTAVYKRRTDRLRVNTWIARFSKVWRRWNFAQLRRNASGQIVYHPTFFEVDPWIAKRADATVVTVYDMISEIFPSVRKSGETSLEMKRRALAMSKLAICISESTRRDLMRFVPDLKIPTSVIPLAAEVVTPSAVEEQLAADLGPFLLLVGQRGGYKNGIAGFKTFRLLAETDPSLKLVCYGGKPPTREELEAAGGEQFAGRIRHLSGDDGQLVALYRFAVALLYPSRYEGFGLPILEAMQAGCPVITPPLSSLPEVGGDAAIYIGPDDFQAAAVAIRSLMSNRAELHARKSSGIERSRLFSWRHTALLTRLAYQAALAAGQIPQR